MKKSIASKEHNIMAMAVRLADTNYKKAKEGLNISECILINLLALYHKEYGFGAESHTAGRILTLIRQVKSHLGKSDGN